MVQRRLASALVLIAFTALTACTSGDSDIGTQEEAQAGNLVPDTLVLGFLPSARAEELLPDANKLGQFLGERMGRPVKVVVPSAYEPLLEGFRFGHVHVAFLDGGPAWIAHKRSGAEVILAEQKDGSTFYYAEAFARSDSPIQSIADIGGKRIAFTSRTGSSGFLMPIGSLISSGFLKPAGSELTDMEDALRATFASTVETGGYQQALQALLDDRADVAFGAHDAPERFLNSDSDRARIKSIHRFGRIPSHSVMVARELAPSVVDSFRSAVLALNEPENLPLLRAIYGVDGLVPATTSDHLAEFGSALSALPGMERTLLAKIPG